MRIQDGSSAVLQLQASSFTVHTSWLTQVTIKGSAARLKADLRHQSQINAQIWPRGQMEIGLDENSTFEAGPVNQGTDWARHDSRVIVEKSEGWESLVLKEGATKEIRNPAP